MNPGVKYRYDRATAIKISERQLILKSRFNRKDADKTALFTRIDSLTADLTAIDAARAVALT